MSIDPFDFGLTRNFGSCHILLHRVAKVSREQVEKHNAESRLEVRKNSPVQNVYHELSVHHRRQSEHDESGILGWHLDLLLLLPMKDPDKR